jgi:hypothetical protein
VTPARGKGWAAMFALSVAFVASHAQAQRCRDCVPEDTTRHVAFHPALGLRIGEPQQASVAVGVLAGSRWQSRGREHARDAALFVEPGLSGGRVSLGYGAYGRGLGSGGAIAATVLRTWRNPWGVKPNVTYAGGELFVWPLMFIGPRVGVFHSISPGNAANRWLFSVDLGVGF